MPFFIVFHFYKGKIMRAYNFCAGPAALPTAVLEKAQQELLDWQGKGLSIMEMSHRSADYVAVAEKAEAERVAAEVQVFKICATIHFILMKHFFIFKTELKMHKSMT